jgi:phosphoglycerol transferase
MNRGDVAAPGPRRLLVELAIAAGLSVVAAVLLLHLWEADLRVPFDYGGDGLWTTLLFKTMVEHGWVLVNPQLGAPLGLQLYDFPQADNLHLLAVKALSLFSADWALLMNVYFLAGFPLIAGATLAVLRRLRIGFGPALVASLLYAFLPCRLLKGEQHLFLGTYFQVPFAMLVAVWLCGDHPPFGPGWRRGAGRRRSLAAVLICVMVSMTGLYFAFFTGALLLAGGGWASIDRRRGRNALAALALTGVILLGLAVNALPTIAHDLRHGSNAQVAIRSPREAEILGLKITQLLLPVAQHRLPALRALRQRYDAETPLKGENSVTNLGLAGSLGFLMLLGLALLRPRPDRPREDLLRPLGVLNLSAVLLGTIGGFGSLVALLVTPQVRAYSRINVMIGFVSLTALALLLERLCGRSRRAAWLVLPGVLLLGLLDQVTPPAVRPYAGIKQLYQRDGQLVQAIEAGAPPAAMIFQLPYLEFPEAGGRERMGDYEPIRPYLHSHSRGLRWSYPTMRGRAGDSWNSQLSQLPLGRLVETLAEAGFHGILIDRYGYRDAGAELEAALGGLLGVKPLVGGADDRLVFFSLADYSRRTLGDLPPAERQRRRELAVHPILFQWAAGFYNAERSESGPFRWCADSCDIAVENPSPVERRVSLAVTLGAAQPPARLSLDGDLLNREMTLTQGGTRLQETLTVPPGRHLIRLRSDSRPAPGDPRRLILRVENPVIDQLRDPP